MSQTEQELVKIKEVIEQRKQEAITKGLWTKLKRIAKVLGDHSDWGGGEYNFHEKGLSINYSYHVHEHIRVYLGYKGKDVYRCKLKYPDKEDVYLYIPGEWEKRLDILLKQCPQVEEERKENSLIRELNNLKEEWGI